MTVTLALATLAACGSSAKSAEPRAEIRGHSYASTSVTGHTMPAGTKITLAFGVDGKLSANAGCNTMGGNYVVQNGRLVVGGLAVTEMGCLPSARQAQDSWFAGVLRSGPQIVQSGKTLTLTAGPTTIDLAEP